ALGVAHLHGHAAGEIHAEVQAVYAERGDRGDQHHQRHAHGELADAEEVDVRYVVEEFHCRLLRNFCQTGSLSSFRPPNTAFTMERVPMMAVNSEVMMPSVSVTAKPFTGPEPNRNSMKAAISVVTWASTMVAKARS